MDEFPEIWTLCLLSMTPEEQIYALLQRLRRVSVFSRHLVNTHMRGGMRVVSETQHMGAPGQTLLTTTVVFGSAWIIPYFNAARDFLLRLPALRHDRDVHAMIDGMDRFISLEIVQRDAIDNTARICARISNHMAHTGNVPAESIRTLERAATSTIAAMYLYYSEQSLGIHTDGLTLMRDMEPTLNHPNRPAGMRTAQSWVDAMGDILVFSMLHYRSNFHLQLLAIQRLHSLARLDPAYAVSMQARGIRESIHQALLAHPTGQPAVELLQVAVPVLQLLGITPLQLATMCIAITDAAAVAAAAAAAAYDDDDDDDSD